MQKISVLIPVYNREQFIAKTLKSICKQKYTNLDIIIYDDGSTDKSVEIIQDFINHDKRIRLIKGQKNQGIGFARNCLLDACNTKYAIWQDSDDISDLHRIVLQIKAMNKDLLVFCEWAWLHETSKGWKKRLCNTNKKAFATLMFPVNKNIRFSEKLRIGGEDWKWIEEMQKVYESIEISPRLYFVRYHNDRIGHWKKIIRAKVPKEIISQKSYAELIQYCKEHYE